MRTQDVLLLNDKEKCEKQICKNRLKNEIGKPRSAEEPKLHSGIPIRLETSYGAC